MITLLEACGEGSCLPDWVWVIIVCAPHFLASIYGFVASVQDAPSRPETHVR